VLTAARFKDEWLIRALLSRKLLSPAAVQALRAAGAPYACAELLRGKHLTKEQLALAVKQEYRVGFEELSSGGLNKLALAMIPERLCRQHQMIPFRVEADHIDLLMANPIDEVALGDAASISGRRPVPFFCPPERIEELIASGYSSDSVIADILLKLPDEEPVECLDDQAKRIQADSDKAAVDAPVVRLADGIIAQAVRMKASDIHIEQEEFSTIVRYRIDGDLRNMLTLPQYIGAGPLISRIKIMSNLDVADHRLPQDGRAKLLVGKQEFGLRVSTIPTAFGEKAVMRILDPRSAQVPLESLGLRPEVLERMIRLSQSDKGMMLITGPTGSGKTTTLYSILNRLKSVKINVVTVEDPIEYRMAGINQTQVNEKAGLTFAAVLRSVLRQDPDVVLVGEIRDRETADIALQAALTGHMVFSTLHTNDAISTINRLLDMGIERFKFAPALIGIVSQRLVRRVCPDCRVEEAPAAALAELLAKWKLPARRFKGKGCPRCQLSGLQGRTGLLELLDLSEQAARDMVAGETDLGVLRRECLDRGWLLTMEQDILWHLAHGDIEEEEALAMLKPPASDGAHDVRTPEAKTPSAAAAPRADARRILVVDDNADNRSLVRDTLGSEGYALTEADGGKAALEKVQREKPDLVLLDLMMPAMDGFAVLKRLRGELGLTELPIMILTALSDAESQSLALEVGADDYLTKPFNPVVLRARIKALLRRTACRAPAPA
jgi:type IV pilus assembly protein PilB